MSGPATPASGPTTPVNDPKDTSYHPMSDDSMHLDGTTLQTEKKYIVFESCLWELLSACTKCGESSTITKHTHGSSLTVKATCPLGHQKVWSSQPTTNGMAAGNILLAGAILFSGASAVKVLRLLASVNIEAFTTSTYNVYQKGCLVPAITKNPQVKTSPQLEKVGFVQCLGELHSKDLKVSTVTTDRHPGICKHIREKEPGIKHELDSWHVVKGLWKKLEGIAKRAGCTILNGWIQSICNHLYFSVAMSEGNVALQISIWKNYVQELLEATVEECSSGSFRSMRESRTIPRTPPMSASYARLPKHALVAKRMLRFKT
ncbi:hypothetical protein HPB49_008925 [Dermacentor silvarum]|uniref:Uncharacterized protein n=1 Tax=Dermacentor silvarum TaxID=543639 RepID=A0ACB8CWF2_DERSI|nr:hypothetical protein HPB49_008925 [Dermacentor silvarum]